MRYTAQFIASTIDLDERDGDEMLVGVFQRLAASFRKWKLSRRGERKGGSRRRRKEIGSKGLMASKDDSFRNRKNGVLNPIAPSYTQWPSNYN